MMGWWGGFN